MDIFGQNVQLSYKGSQIYKTFCGGVSTILILIFILFYFYDKVIFFTYLDSQNTKIYFFFEKVTFIYLKRLFKINANFIKNFHSEKMTV